jgi:hypothetical protein
MMINKLKKWELKKSLHKKRWLWTPYALVMLPLLPVFHFIVALSEYDWHNLNYDYKAALKLLFHWVDKEQGQ